MIYQPRKGKICLFEIMVECKLRMTVSTIYLMVTALVCIDGKRRYVNDILKVQQFVAYRPDPVGFQYEAFQEAYFRALLTSFRIPDYYWGDGRKE